MEAAIGKLVSKITDETSNLVIADLLEFLTEKGLLTDPVAAALACETYKDTRVSDVLLRVGAVSEPDVIPAVKTAPSRKGKKKHNDAPTHTSDLLDKEDYLL